MTELQVPTKSTHEEHTLAAAIKNNQLSTHSGLVETDTIRSSYLVERLNQTPELNLFNFVKFKLIQQHLPCEHQHKLRILDIGCGLKVAKNALEHFGTQFSYFGVDYESVFSPDAVFDALHATQLPGVMPWLPNTVMLLDVLEHLHEEETVLDDVIKRLSQMLPKECTVLVTLPQMYRLDKYKLKHLHYPEHKIRLTQGEWRQLLEPHFHVKHTQGLGYLSVLPYLPMASKRYTPDNTLGKLFMHLRGHTLERQWIKHLDWTMTKTLGKSKMLKQISNDILFVLTPK